MVICNTRNMHIVYFHYLSINNTIDSMYLWFDILEINFASLFSNHVKWEKIRISLLRDAIPNRLRWIDVLMITIVFDFIFFIKQLIIDCTMLQSLSSRTLKHFFLPTCHIFRREITDKIIINYLPTYLILCSN